MMPQSSCPRDLAIIRIDCLMSPMEVADTEVHDSGRHTPSVVPRNLDTVGARQTIFHWMQLNRNGDHRSYR